MEKEQTTADERGFHRISLRLPNDLHDTLKRVSDEEERSLHAHIIWCLRQCAKTDQKGRRS